jgi:D-3-phosphoglycerate dehydrogenase
MIAQAQLAAMRPGSYLLNLSRGQVVDVPALAGALKSKHLAGAAVDVFPEEPEGNGPGFSSPLCGLPNVILTPHVGGSTLEAQEAIGREVSEKLVEYVRLGTTTSSVNFPEVALPKPVHPSSTQRVLNVHHNVPGVLRDIHTIVSATSANIEGQVLATDTNIGYLLMDLGKEVSADVQRGIAALTTSIRTRIVG